MSTIRSPSTKTTALQPAAYLAFCLAGSEDFDDVTMIAVSEVCTIPLTMSTSLSGTEVFVFQCLADTR